MISIIFKADFSLVFNPSVFFLFFFYLFFYFFKAYPSTKSFPLKVSKFKITCLDTNRKNENKIVSLDQERKRNETNGKAK